MKTRTLTTVVVVLVVVVAGLIGYQQWDPPPAASEAPGSTAGGGASSDARREITASPAAIASVAGTPVSAAGGANAKGVPPAIVVRPLTVAEKDEVAKAMVDFRKRLALLDRVGALKSQRDVAEVEELAKAKLESRTGEVPVNGEKATVASFSKALASRMNEPQTEQIAAASASLSEVLKSFESGSPAWREARAQGEKMMREFGPAASTYKLIMSTKLEGKTSGTAEILMKGAPARQVIEDMGIEVQGASSSTITDVKNGPKIDVQPSPKDEKMRKAP
jgi:hypothetical protein